MAPPHEEGRIKNSSSADNRPGSNNNSHPSTKERGKLKKKLKGIKSESKIQTSKRIFDVDEADTRFKKRQHENV